MPVFEVVPLFSPPSVSALLVVGCCPAVLSFFAAIQRIRDKRIEEQLDELKVKEMQKYCEVFRQYCLVAGDLSDRCVAAAGRA